MKILRMLGAASLAFACAMGCAASPESEEDDDDGGSKQGLAATSGGSSSESYDNVSACRSWVETVQCGSTDVAMYVRCEDYAAAACDISGYFDCLSSHTSCSDGFLDTSGWAQCAQQATCGA